VLYDLGDDDELAWRRAGDSWEPPLEHDEGEAEAACEGGVHSLIDIAAAIKASERCVMQR
jgi:hypothetical protein